MIKIFRFSNDGFKPQFQSNLKEHSEHTLENLLSLIPENNEYLKNLVVRGFTTPDENFEYEGIFVFLIKPSIEDKRYFLNHLDNIENIKLNEAFIKEDAICYIDDGTVYNKENKILIKEALDKKINTIYIPKSQLFKIVKNKTLNFRP